MDTITPFVLTERQLRNFHAKVKTSTMNFYNGTPCQEWGGTRLKKGYGRFFVNGKLQVSHRVAWLLAHGEIPDGLCVLHYCDNPSCCEEAHLFTGTHQDNMLDKEAKGRGNHPKGDKCGVRLHPESRPRGDKHQNAKLTEADIPEVFRLRSYGMSLMEIGVVFAVANTQIARVLRRETWAHVIIYP